MINFDSFVLTLDELVNANPHARSKGNAFKQWCKENFNINARISYVKAQQQITNRVSEQFRYFDPLVVFVCNDDVKRESIVKYILERGYAKLQCVAIIGVKINEEGKTEYDFEQLITYKKSDFYNWASLYFSQKNDARALKQQAGFENEDIEDETQIIYYGAPGTGKSFTINKITEEIDNITTENGEEPRVFRTTFHPDSDYSTFIGSYKPTKTKKAVRNVAGDIVKHEGSEVFEDVITYNFVPQTFTKAYIRAWQTDEPVYLVIEEINRGNCAQIFGDLFQLLDRDGINESKYSIDPDADLGKFIAEKLEGYDVPDLIKRGMKLKLPSNLYIWATMNTSDQSLFPIDSAFKRRWDWRYIKIVQPKDIETGEKLDWQIEGDYDWWKFIQNINSIIYKMTNSADKQLGYFFTKADSDGIIKYSRFVSKVCFYLWNDIFKTYAMDGMENSLFKYTYIDEDDSTEKTGVLDFTKFFDDEGKVVPAIVQQFIENVMNWQSEAK